jgi:hypothetical protein
MAKAPGSISCVDGAATPANQSRRKAYQPHLLGLELGMRISALATRRDRASTWSSTARISASMIQCVRSSRGCYQGPVSTPPRRNDP